MFSKLFNIFQDKSRLKRLPLFLVLFSVLLPVLCVAGYLGVEEYKEHNEWAFSQREKIAFTAVELIEQKLGCVIDVSSSLSDTILFQKMIRNGQWDDSINYIDEGLEKKYNYVDTVSLYDSKGVLKATTSGDVSGLGKNFASEDYYIGVSKNWEPYVSGVFRKKNDLNSNFFSVAIPVWSDAQKITGVVVMDIKLDVISGWINSIDINHSGYIYVVDQKGFLVAHPHLSLEDDITDYSSVLAVQKVLKEESGALVTDDSKEDEKQLTVYMPVSSFGWGVIVLQPAGSAFAERNRTVVNSIILWLLLVSSTGFFVYRILRSKTMLKIQSDREQRLIDSLGDGVVATDKKWNIILWNKSASEITGWPKNEVIGRPVHPILKLIRERDRKEVLPLEYAFVEKNPPHWRKIRF